MNSTRLEQSWVERLIASPCDQFVVLAESGNKISTVGLLTIEEEDTIHFNRDTAIMLRPDKLPEGTEHSMLSLVPLFVGNINVGWLFQFPAIQVTVGRNFVKVMRAKAMVTERKNPHLTVLLRNIVVMEMPDIMTLVLVNRSREMRT